MDFGAGARNIGDCVCGGSTKHDDFQEGVGAKTVGAVNGDTGAFAASVETFDDYVAAFILIRAKNAVL